MVLEDGAAPHEVVHHRRLGRGHVGRGHVGRGRVGRWGDGHWRRGQWPRSRVLVSSLTLVVVAGAGLIGLTLPSSSDGRSGALPPAVSPTDGVPPLVGGRTPTPTGVPLIDLSHRAPTGAPSAPASEGPIRPVGAPGSSGGHGAWLAGAGTDDPYAWGAWRGSPVQVWEAWNNYKTWADMTALYTVHSSFTGEGPAPFNRRFPGRLSMAQPMWAAGEDADSCGSGRNDAHMRAIVANLRSAWGPDAYIRLGWEMNGYWSTQSYAPANPPGWVSCWRRWYTIIKSVSPGFLLVWNPNAESNTNGQGPFDVRRVWPGDAYVDVAGPDYYDWSINPNATTAATHEPHGINAWVSFVAAHHKPLAVPEWGLNATGPAGDDPAFIQQMFDTFTAVRGSPTGLAYESYFDLLGCRSQLGPGGCNPRSSALYQALW